MESATVTFDAEDLRGAGEAVGKEMATERYRARMRSLQAEMDKLYGKLEFERRVGKPVDALEQERLDVLPQIMERETKLARDEGIQF